ncbi:MAG TPA: TerC family protein [Candidatus Angelobacter sp.]|nr:TerC family protein [Candidatus Angelobacter sp.]
MLLFWIVFNAYILFLLLVDLLVINKPGRIITFKQTLLSCAVWIGLALIFAVAIHFIMGGTKSLEFLTGYLVEEALSIDNLFVFILLFAYFKVPPEQERTVLFWGILGAMIMRAFFIVAGIALVKRFHWILYLFGAFLVYSGLQLLRGKENEVDPSRSFVLRFAKKLFPVTDTYEGGKFFVIREGKRFATPLLIVLLIVETTDILFATDSIPAILAITRDSFIVYTSNVFAILGLRSLYFAISGLMKLFHHLHYGLALVLVFIGAKMLIQARYEFHTATTLIVIVSILGLSILASILFPPKAKEEPKQDVV